MAVYICLRLSECMNPFLYNMASTKMRRASVRALGRIFYCLCRYEWKTWKRQETNSENNRTERSITNCTTTGTTSLLARANTKMYHCTESFIINNESFYVSLCKAPEKNSRKKTSRGFLTPVDFASPNRQSQSDPSIFSSLAQLTDPQIYDSYYVSDYDSYYD